MVKIIELVTSFFVGILKYIPNKIIESKFFHLGFLGFCIAFMVFFGVLYYFMA